MNAPDPIAMSPRPRFPFHRGAAAVLGAAVLAVAIPAAGAGGLESAPTLVRPATPSKAPDERGFIQRWVLLEPIPSTGLGDKAVRDALAKEQFPGQLTAVPRDGDTVTVGGATLAWHAVDTREYNVNLFHFARALGKPTSNILTWGVTVVECPEDIPGVRLAIGSNAASVWWVNGTEAVAIYGDRQTVIDDGVSRRLTLRKGTNVVRCAVFNGGGATDFCARFLDEDGRPVRAFAVHAPAAPAAKEN